MGDRITIDGDCYMEGFFEEYDVSKPIYIVYALRRNKYSYSGNTFSESGINSSDLIDYSSGVGASDAHRLHDQGNYSRTVDTYEYSPFYLGWSDGKATMLSVSEGDEAAIQFFRYVIDEDSLLRQERERATRDVGVFVKGNDQISSVDPSLLHRIQAFVGFTNEKKEIINYYTDSVSLIPDVKVNIYVRTDVSYDSEGWPVEMGKVVLVNDFQEKKEYQLKGYDYIEKIEIVGQSNDMTLQFINGKNNKIVHEEKTISLNGTKIYTTSDPKGQEDKYYQEWLNTKLDGLIIKILYKDKIIFEGKINP
jgi:hypothetical protein